MTVNETPDLHYTDPVLAAIYDTDSGWSADRDFYLALAGPTPVRILDLGCGTGLLCDAYAAVGHSVTGVDPAPAMLDVARTKPQGAAVTWVQSTAQDFQSPHRFDLIIMTGHAFQVLLSDDAINATFATMRQHLAPGGRIVFESRNPGVDWAKRWNTGAVSTVNGQLVQETRRVISATGNRIRFDTHYTIDGITRVSHSELLFLSAAEITGRLIRAGLHVNDVLGDWTGGRFAPDHSEEMIFIIGHGKP
jgi:2-polyprenyl-3-methyl-5-hydroxy-6-metoxy-1,4-benzoquinol methylase